MVVNAHWLAILMTDGDWLRLLMTSRLIDEVIG